MACPLCGNADGVAEDKGDGRRKDGEGDCNVGCGCTVDAVGVLVIDLGHGAAEELGLFHSGIAQVKLEVLQ